MDVVTYGALKGKGNQGSYSSVSDLPANAKEGATAVVDGVLYYYADGQWVSANAGASAITDAQIDAIFG